MEEEVINEYQSSLNDLTFNSKPLINMLTMLADDNEQHASHIVEVIESHINKAQPQHKLPALYLVDSIMKNLPKSTYLSLFTHNIVSTFCGMFEKVDEKARQSMFKVRQTWNDLFPNRKLYAIDVRVNLVDPAWPITAQAPVEGNIHVNPKFLAAKGQKEEEEEEEEDFPDIIDTEEQEAKMRQQLIAKQQELLKLQQQRLELELKETKAKLEQQKQINAGVKVNLEPAAIASSIDASVNMSSVPPPVSNTQTGPAASRPVTRDPRLATRDPRLQTRGPSAASSLTTQPEETFTAPTCTTLPPFTAPPVVIDVVHRNPPLIMPPGLPPMMPPPHIAPAGMFQPPPGEILLRPPGQPHANLVPPHTTLVPSGPPPPQMGMIQLPTNTDPRPMFPGMLPFPMPTSQQNAEIEQVEIDQNNQALTSTDGEEKPEIKFEKKEQKPSAKSDKSKNSSKSNADGRHSDSSRRHSDSRRDSTKDKKERESKDYKNTSPSSSSTGRRSSPRQSRSSASSSSREETKSRRGDDEDFRRKKRGSRDSDEDSRSKNSREIDKKRDSKSRSSKNQKSDSKSTGSKSSHDKSPSRRSRSPVRKSRSPDTKTRNEKSKDKTKTNSKSSKTEEINKTSKSKEKTVTVKKEPGDPDIDKKQDSEVSEAMDTDDRPKNDPKKDIRLMKIPKIKKEKKDEEKTEDKQEKEHVKPNQDSLKRELKDTSLEVSSEGSSNSKKIRLDDTPETTTSEAVASQAVDDDLSSLFGTEDTDYRSIRSSSATQKSPHHARWAKFRSQHPDDFKYELEHERDRDNVEESMETELPQDTDLRSSFSKTSSWEVDPVMDSDLRQMNPNQKSIDIPTALSLDNREEIMVQIQKRRLSGELSFDQERELLVQLCKLDEVQKQQKLLQKSEKRESNTLEEKAAHGRIHREIADPIKEERVKRDVTTENKLRRESPVKDIYGAVRHTYGGRRESPLKDVDRRGPERPIIEDFDGRKPNERDIVGRSPGERDFDGRGPGERDFDGRGPGERDFDGRGPGERDFDGRDPGERDFDGRGPRERDFDGRGPGGRDFDGRGPGGRDFDGRGPGGRDFDGRSPGERDFDGRGPGGRDFDGRGPGERDFDGRGPGGRDFDGRGLGEREFDGRGPGGRDFDGRGPGARDFNRRGPAERDFDRRSPGARDFDGRGPGERDFDGRGPGERDFDGRGPGGRDFDGRGPGGRDFRGRSPGKKDFDRRDPDGGRFHHPLQDKDRRGHRYERDLPGPSRNERERETRRDWRRAGRSEYGQESDSDSRDKWKSANTGAPPQRNDRHSSRHLEESHHGDRHDVPHSCRHGDARDGPPHPGRRGDMRDGPDRFDQHELPQREIPSLLDGPLMERPFRQFDTNGPPNRREDHFNGKDPRWRNSQGMGMLRPEENEEFVIDGKPYGIQLGQPARKIRFGFQYIEVFADPNERAIRLDGKIVYRFGDFVKDIQFLRGKHKVFYHGLPRLLWIDGILRELRVDAPPKIINIKDKEFTIRIDGRDNMIIIDNKEYGQYGGPPRYIFLKNNRCQLRFDPPPRKILIDKKMCELKLDRAIPCVIVDNKPRGIRFDGPPREIIVNDVPYLVPMDESIKIKISNRPHFLAFGGPAHEVILDGKWFEVKFGGPKKEISLGNRVIEVKLEGPPPDVKILDEIVEEVLPPPNLSGQLPQNIPGPRGPMQGPRGPLQGPRGPVPGPSQPMQGPRGPMPGPNGPPNDLQHPQGPMHIPNGPPGGLQGPQGPRPMEPRMMNVQGAQPGFGQGPLGPRGPISGPLGPGGPGMMERPIRPPQQMMPERMMGPGLQQGQMMHPPNMMMQNNQGPQQQVMTGDPMQPQFGGQLPQQNQMMQGMGLQEGVMPQHQMGAQPIPNSMSNMFGQASTQPQPNMQLDVNSLLQRLQAAGIIGKSEENKPQEKTAESADKQNTENSEDRKEDVEKVVIKPVKLKSIPNLTSLKTEVLKKHYEGVIQRLSSGIQCSSCGQRFTAQQTDTYRDHLDWHFRQNRKDKDDAKVTKFRRWFYNLGDWLEYEEIDESEDKGRSAVFEQMLTTATSSQSSQKTEPAFVLPEGSGIIHRPVATGDENGDICEICKDPFEQFWDEEEEEWHLRDAIRVDSKTYHPVCYEDEKEESILEPTPTPVKAPPVNPLILQIQQELGLSSSHIHIDPTSVKEITEATTLDLPDDDDEDGQSTPTCDERDSETVTDIQTGNPSENIKPEPSVS